MLRAICICGLLLLLSVGTTGCKTRTLEIPESSSEVGTSDATSGETPGRTSGETPGRTSSGTGGGSIRDTSTSTTRTTPTDGRGSESTPRGSSEGAADAGPGLAVGPTLRAASTSWEVELRAGPLAGASEARSPSWTLRLDPTPRAAAESNEE